MNDERYTAKDFAIKYGITYQIVRSELVGGRVSYDLLLTIREAIDNHTRTMIVRQYGPAPSRSIDNADQVWDDLLGFYATYAEGLYWIERQPGTWKGKNDSDTVRQAEDAMNMRNFLRNSQAWSDLVNGAIDFNQ